MYNEGVKLDYTFYLMYNDLCSGYRVQYYTCLLIKCDCSFRASVRARASTRPIELWQGLAKAGARTRIASGYNAIEGSSLCILCYNLLCSPHLCHILMHIPSLKLPKSYSTLLW